MEIHYQQTYVHVYHLNVDIFSSLLDHFKKHKPQHMKTCSSPHHRLYSGLPLGKMIHTISCSCISIAGWDCSVECTGDKTFFSVTHISPWICADKHLVSVCGTQIFRTQKSIDKIRNSNETLQARTSLLFPTAKFQLSLWTVL